MELDKQGPNVTVLTLSDGSKILFSYSTPVSIIDRQGKAFKTRTYYSKTTTKHVADFLAADSRSPSVTVVNQEVIDAFTKEAR